MILPLLTFRWPSWLVHLAVLAWSLLLGIVASSML